VSASDEATTTTCYRHPNRPAPLRCTRCERPICLDDAVDAPVGFLCPDDARQPARVRAVSRAGGAPVTRALIGVAVVVFLLQQVSSEPFVRGALFGPAVAGGEWWRLVTAGFLHGGLLHIGFNGYLLWMLGQMLEPALGRARFSALFAAGLLGGSAGALALTWTAPTIGASGAVFGLMGAAMVGMRVRGVNPMQTSIGSLVVLNLVLTFVLPGISIGGHVGGLLGGALAALPVFRVGRPYDRTSTVGAWLVAAALGALGLFVGVTGPLL
jgi:membrane associated rhomboid family serine protease